MKYDYQELAQLPDTLTLEDFRVACHISKRTARYYLQSGLVPCSINGKKTHCYTIKKNDLLAALKEYESQPCKFAIPQVLYEDQRNQRSLARMQLQVQLQALTFLPKEELYSPTVRRFYEKKLSEFPDLLDSVRVETITGYDRKTVRRWCNEGKIRCFSVQPRIYVPKEYLLCFLLSEDYNNITRKSQVHLDDLLDIHKKIHRGG